MDPGDGLGSGDPDGMGPGPMGAQGVARLRDWAGPQVKCA